MESFTGLFSNLSETLTTNFMPIAVVLVLVLLVTGWLVYKSFTGSKPEPEHEPEPEAESRSVELPEINACKETLSSLGIEDLSSYRKWIRDNQNDPRLPEVNNCADIVLKNRTGGMRKKKLRTRREGKQNVGRTRRSKNRANRSH